MTAFTKKKKIIICAAAAAGIIIISGGIIASRFSSNANSENEVYTFQAAALTNTPVGLVSRFAGVVEPQTTLKIQKASDQKVKELYVKVGDTVKKGAPLFSYDVDEIQINLSTAELELERITNEIATLYSQIELLEKEKKAAPESEVFSYTTQILTAQNDIKRAEYNKKSKSLEIEQIKKSVENAVVVSEIDGIVKSINDGSSSLDYSSGSDDAYITILSDSEYRVKGKLNEQNIASLSVGQAVWVHSRTGEDLAWNGTVTEIDTQNPVSSENMYYSSDQDSTSSSYNFYVELNDPALLMLGQHVFIEPDIGQNTVKSGLWLPSYYIIYEDDQPYVWVANKKDRLEKQSVVLGQFDEDLSEYEITDGLTAQDFIAFPDDTLTEGMHCRKESASTGDEME